MPVSLPDKPTRDAEAQQYIKKSFGDQFATETAVLCRELGLPDDWHIGKPAFTINPYAETVQFVREVVVTKPPNPGHPCISITPKGEEKLTAMAAYTGLSVWWLSVGKLCKPTSMKMGRFFKEHMPDAGDHEVRAIIEKIRKMRGRYKAIENTTPAAVKAAYSISTHGCMAIRKPDFRGSIPAVAYNILDDTGHSWPEFILHHPCLRSVGIFDNDTNNVVARGILVLCDDNKWHLGELKTTVHSRLEDFKTLIAKEFDAINEKFDYGSVKLGDKMAGFEFTIPGIPYRDTFWMPCLVIDCVGPRFHAKWMPRSKSFKLSSKPFKAGDAPIGGYGHAGFINFNDIA